MRQQPRTVLPRLLAGTSALGLALVAAVALYLTQLLRGLVADGRALVSDMGADTAQLIEYSTDGIQTDAALLAASSAERYALDLLGDIGLAAARFQLLLLVSLLSAAVAIAVATRRLPHDRRPEFAWAAAAALALLPATMLQLWLIVALPAAMLFALAATLHCTRRHDLTLSRGAKAAKRQALSVAPPAQAAARQGSLMASRFARSGREQLPGAREKAELLGHKGRGLAERSAPLARASLRRLRRTDDDRSV